MLEIIWAIIGGVSGLFLKETKPHHIALGVAMGVMIGLMPKANLIALMLIMALFFFRCNLGFGILAAALVSLAMPKLDVATHQLGNWLLANESLVGFIGTLFQYPFFAWSAVNNTVVFGSFVMGVIAFVPVYVMVFIVCRLFLRPKSEIPPTTNTQAITR
jgi:TIGR03546 family protein